MQRDTPPFVWAAPDEKNILHWSYMIRGPPDSPYAGGEYYGVIMFPSEYPFKPPGIKMVTPSGRFQPDKKICFSMSDFHPGSWNPAWSVATILTGLLSFMLSDEMTTGSVTTTVADKKAYARLSHAWNIQQKRFKEAFPEYCDTVMKDLPNMAEKELGGSRAELPPTPTNVTPPVPTPSGSSSNASAEQNRSLTEVKKELTVPKELNDGSGGAGKKALSWGHIIWNRWYWGLFLAVALALSRVTSNA